jgi:hypothetical protein
MSDIECIVSRFLYPNSGPHAPEYTNMTDEFGDRVVYQEKI